MAGKPCGSVAAIMRRAMEYAGAPTQKPYQQRSAQEAAAFLVPQIDSGASARKEGMHVGA